MAKKKITILIVTACIVIGGIWAAWNRWASTTRIGLLNFQSFQTTSFVKSNTERFVEYEEIPLDKFGRLGRYDFILGFGMGMKITEEQRQQIQKAADKGAAVYIYAATNPANAISSLDSTTQAASVRATTARVLMLPMTVTQAEPTGAFPMAIDNRSQQNTDWMGRSRSPP